MLPLAFLLLAPAAPSTAQRWIGEWTRDGSRTDAQTVLTISEAKGTTFEFSMTGSNGGAIDELTGTAKIDGRRASWTDPDAECALSFAWSKEAIEVDARACAIYSRNGIEWGGHFTHEGSVGAAPTLQERGIVDAAQDAELLRLAGDHYALFQDCFQLVSEDADQDGFGARVRSGGVRGLFTEMEAIVMTTPDGRLWAAVIDAYAQSVRYVTNAPEWRQKLPKTIEAWRSRFPEKKVIFPEPSSAQ